MNYIARFLFDSAASCVMMIVRWMVHVWHTTVVYVSTILRNLITWNPSYYMYAGLKTKLKPNFQNSHLFLPVNKENQRHFSIRTLIFPHNLVPLKKQCQDRLILKQNGN